MGGPTGAATRAPERAPERASDSWRDGRPLPPVADWPRTGAERGDQFGGYGHRDAEPRGLARTDRDTGEADLFAPTADELARWEAPPVREFRRKFGWYAIIGSVLLLVSLLGDRDFFGAFALWTVYIAYRYAKLWSDGFDWHDAMRQSRERLFADVVAEWGDDLQAVFDPAKRAKVRERQRRRRMRRAAWDQAAYRGVRRAGGAGRGAPGRAGVRRRDAPGGRRPRRDRPAARHDAQGRARAHGRRGRLGPRPVREGPGARRDRRPARPGRRARRVGRARGRDHPA
jgi:hypothetical protein